ncbi:MAG: SRPBCC domain-containing protein [Phycisphaerae bacterium]
MNSLLVLLTGAALLGGGVNLRSGENPMHEVHGRTANNAQRIDLKTMVNASLKDVWHAWTTNEGAQTFFARNSNVRLEIGGPFELFFSPDNPKGERGAEGCHILSYLPMEMISFSWSAPPQFAHARRHRTWVVIRFEQLGPKQTRVKLTHLGWDEMKTAHPEHIEEWEQVHRYFTEAWPSVLEHLKQRFDKGPRWE